MSVSLPMPHGIAGARRTSVDELRTHVPYLTSQAYIVTHKDDRYAKASPFNPLS